ncbi:MAG: type II toxin-antitoxin system VapC family toxin [Armatimonadota bacterium]
MNLYLDTSALVKLYVNEDGSTPVRQAVDEARLVATSAIAYVEARAAFARRYRERAMSTPDYRRSVRRFNTEWPQYFRLEVTDVLIRSAARAAERYELRAYDAVHLAAALTLKERLSDRVAFACWDVGLEAAARRAGFEQIPGRERRPRNPRQC